MSNQVKKLVKGDFKVSSLIKLVTFLLGSQKCGLLIGLLSFYSRSPKGSVEVFLGSSLALACYLSEESLKFCWICIVCGSHEDN